MRIGGDTWARPASLGRLAGRSRAAIAAVAAALACLAVPAPAARAGNAAFTAAADSYVRSDAPRANFGASPRISAEGHPEGVRKAYLRFDVKLPPRNEVRRATLLLFARSAGSAEGVSVHGLWNARWDEGTISYVNAPSEDPEEVARAGGYPANAWVSFDVTALVSGARSVSMVLRSDSETWHGFRSSENKTPPVLMVETERQTTQFAQLGRERRSLEGPFAPLLQGGLIADPVIAVAVGVACPRRPRLVA